MSKPATLLENLCRHALSHGFRALGVEYKGGHEWVSLRKGDTAIGIANFASSGSDAKELRENLAAARKKPVRCAIDGEVWILTVAAYDSFGEEAYSVEIDPAPSPDPAVAPRFTTKQGQYLAFIYNYSKIHGRAPSELDLQGYFQTTPPTIHDMIKMLELRGFIKRTPGQARSIQVLVRPEHLPTLG